MRRLVVLLLVTWMGVLATVRVAAQPADPKTPAAGTAAPEGDAPSGYDQHMDNGVKLYTEQNYPAAIAEFEAAYKLEPKASPLINMALAYKKLHQYAKAIEVLERAVAKHPDTMQQHHQEAAQKEIRELKALLAWVVVRVKPAEAKLLIDGVPRATSIAAIPLAPGPHVFRAEAAGFTAAETRAQLVSGRDNPAVELTLVPTDGQIEVRAHVTDSWIEIDGNKLAKGIYRGRLAPGVHAVVVYVEDDKHALAVVIQAGKDTLVTQQKDGKLQSDDAAPSDAKIPPSHIPKIPEVLEGFYGVAGIGLLVLVSKPLFAGDEIVPDDSNQAGYVITGHAGYRVADWAAFEGWAQFNHIRASGTFPGTASESTFTLVSGRLGGGLRVMYPGDESVRFLGLVGAGLVIESLEWRDPPAVTGDSTFDSAFGVDPFGQIDLGVEVEVNRILFDVVLQSTIQSSKHLANEGANSVFDDKPMLIVGPVLRIGYGFW